MTPESFKSEAAGADQCDEIDELCFAWLSAASREESPKVEAMMLAALELLRRGLG